MDRRRGTPLIQGPTLSVYWGMTNTNTDTVIGKSEFYLPLTQRTNMSAGKGLLIPLLLLVISAGSLSDIDIGFIIESAGGISGSIIFKEEQIWNRTKELVANIITGLPRHCTKVGLIIFSERSEVVLLFKSINDAYHARDYILTLHSHGSSFPTNTPKALYVARTELFNGVNEDREDAHNVAVLITHSRTENPDRTISMAQELHKDGVKVISVGLTDNTDEGVLKAISSPPHISQADYNKISDFHKVNDTVGSIVKNINSYKRTSFGGNLDIGFIIDASGSLAHERNWEPLLKFIGSLIDSFPRVGNQVGAVIYSESAWILFSLDKFKELCDVKQEILRTTNVGHTTNTSAGLHIAQTELFNPNNGDRPDVPNVAILITDGLSDSDPFKDKPNDMIIKRARALHSSGVKVLCIGFTNKIKEDQLREISSPPHQKDVNYFLVSYADQLKDIIDVLVVQIDVGQSRTSTRSTDRGKLHNSTSPAPQPRSDGPETSLVLYVVLPVLGGLLIVAVVLIVGCVLYKKRKRVAGTDTEASGIENYYENHSVTSKPGMEKNRLHGSPVYDEVAKTYIYEEAAPAHIYDDASSTRQYPRQPETPDNLYSDATDVHPPIYDLAEPSDGAYSQVTPATAPQQQATRMESLYGQVQRKRSYIYAQVQKKKSYIYAQVNKVKKRNTDETEA